jgi:hypothetical protein
MLHPRLLNPRVLFRRVLFGRAVFGGVAFAALALFAGPAFSQQRLGPLRWAPRNQVAFRPSGPIKPKVDLRPQIEKLGLAVRDQGNRSTCSVFATTFLIEYHAARAKGMQGLELSE